MNTWFWFSCFFFQIVRGIGEVGDDYVGSLEEGIVDMVKRKKINFNSIICIWGLLVSLGCQSTLSLQVVCHVLDMDV